MHWSSFYLANSCVCTSDYVETSKIVYTESSNLLGVYKKIVVLSVKNGDDLWTKY